MQLRWQVVIPGWFSLIAQIVECFYKLMVQNMSVWYWVFCKQWSITLFLIAMENNTRNINRNIAIASQHRRIGVIIFFSLSNEKIPSVTPLGPYCWSHILLHRKIHLNWLTMLRRLVQANCVVQGTGSPKRDQCFLGNVNTFRWRRGRIGAVVSAPYKAGLLAGYGSALQSKRA